MADCRLDRMKGCFAAHFCAIRRWCATPSGHRHERQDQYPRSPLIMPAGEVRYFLAAYRHDSRQPLSSFIAPWASPHSRDATMALQDGRRFAPLANTRQEHVAMPHATLIDDFRRRLMPPVLTRRRGAEFERTGFASAQRRLRALCRKLIYFWSLERCRPRILSGRFKSFDYR